MESVDKELSKSIQRHLDSSEWETECILWDAQANRLLMMMTIFKFFFLTVSTNDGPDMWSNKDINMTSSPLSTSSRQYMETLKRNYFVWQYAVVRAQFLVGFLVTLLVVFVFGITLGRSLRFFGRECDTQMIINQQFPCQIQHIKTSQDQRWELGKHSILIRRKFFLNCTVFIDQCCKYGGVRGRDRNMEKK